MKLGTVPLQQLTKFVLARLAGLQQALVPFWSKSSVLKNTAITQSFSTDYENWRDRFLLNRLSLGLWIALVLNITSILLDLVNFVFGTDIPKLGEGLILSAVQGLFLLACFALYRSHWGQRHPAVIFLGLSWSLTLVIQVGATLNGFAAPCIGIWSITFLAQAVLMPVRWRLHLVSQLVLLAYYFGVNSWLDLKIPVPDMLDPRVQRLLFSTADFAFYLFWFCLICDISVYLYERLQRTELRSRRELEEAYQKLEAAEAKYHSIFDNAIEGIFQSTPDGRYITANPALARIYGYSSPEAVTAHFNDIEHQLYIDPNRRAEFVRLIEQNNEVSNFESQIYRADGSIVWISEQAKTVRAADGTLLYYEGLIEDITERKQAEESLRVFFHAVSHDLRNPVIGTLLVLKNLQNQAGETISISRSILERMIQSGDRQVKLINSLLEAHSSEVRGVNCKCEPLQLPELIQSVTADLEPLLTQYQATVTNLVPVDLPLVSADPNQLWRVFENLIGNALKHNPPGVSLTLKATVEAQIIRCTVEDNGIGISQQQCERLFELYVRGFQSRHTPGLGLGLYLCKQIITAHGGEIDVQSSPGAGTTFWFTLPLVSN